LGHVVDGHRRDGLFGVQGHLFGHGIEPDLPLGHFGSGQAKQTADGWIKFHIDAVYQTNVGEVSGEAPLSGDAGVDKDSDCALSFKFAAGRLVLSQDGTCGMGLNASGAGMYKRISSAPPKFDD
jgi:hypothetical protein